jgi:hypothetical protein
MAMIHEKILQADNVPLIMRICLSIQKLQNTNFNPRLVIVRSLIFYHLDSNSLFWS